MPEFTPEVRRRITAETVGKVIDGMEWDEVGHYWVMHFADGSETCIRFMAEIE